MCRLHSFIVIFLIFVSSVSYGSKQKPEITKGILDLTSWSIKEDGPLELSGEWEFYWKQFIEPDDIEKHKKDKNYIVVPSQWKDKTFNGQKTTWQGYATYRLTILLADTSEDLGLKVNDVATAYRIFANKTLVGGKGKVSDHREGETWRYEPAVYHIEKGLNKIDLIFHVSNYHERDAGLKQKVVLGNYDKLSNARDTNGFIDFFLFGSILIMGFHHLGLYILRKKDKTNLFFGIFCIIAAARTLITSERILLPLIPKIPFELIYKIDIGSGFVLVPLFALYTSMLFKEDFHKWILKAVTIFLAISALFVIVTPAYIYSHTITYFQILSLLLVFYLLYIFTVSLIKKRENALAMILAPFGIAAAAANDLLYGSHIIESVYLLPYGIFIFIFLQSFLLSKKFSSAFLSIEELSEELAVLNKDLEKKVNQRTVDLLLNEIGSKVYIDIFNNSQNLEAMDSNTIALLQPGLMKDQHGSSIVTLSQDINVISNIDELLAKTVSKLSEVSKAQNIYIYMHNNDTLELMKEFHADDSDCHKDNKYDTHITKLVNDVFEKNNYMITENIRSTIDSSEEKNEVITLPALCFPIISGEKHIGACYLDKRSSEMFSEKEANLVTLFMAGVASVIENSFLFYQYKKEEEHAKEKTLTPYTEACIKQALMYIDENYHDEISREGLAASVGLSPDHFGKFFKIYTDKSLTDYVKELRINEAVRRLEETDKSIAYIGRAVGFTNFSTFHRAFKKVTGISPRELREKRDRSV